MKKVLRRAALALAVVLGALVLLFAGYVGYLQFQYYRIEDNLALEVASAPAETLAAGEEYTAVTCNLGFGAYGPDYSFFMDTGVMEDGTPTQGLYGKARSEEDVLANTTAALDALEELDADLLLLQEVDYDSHRSYFVDQRQMALDAFSDHGWIWGQNFHSGYLAYPLTDHHGVVNSGLLTLTRCAAEGGVRRSYPVDESFFIKFTDLDRCFTVLYLPVEGAEGQLALIHSHMSAYDEGGTVRSRQLELLCSVMEEEYEKGNYVIVGGRLQPRPLRHRARLRKPAAVPRLGADPLRRGPAGALLLRGGGQRLRGGHLPRGGHPLRAGGELHHRCGRLHRVGQCGRPRREHRRGLRLQRPQPGGPHLPPGSVNF